MNVVHVTIGNSDDRLTQRAWSAYVHDVTTVVRDYCSEIYGVFASDSVSCYQNMHISARVADENILKLRGRLIGLRGMYHQSSIAFLVVDDDATEMI